MNKSGPIVVIEDDADDTAMILETFRKIGPLNEVVCFNNGNEAIEYLHKEATHPFLIMSDINMPMINGLELRTKIFADINLRHKCIPYIFFTTSDSKKSIVGAYALSAHGYFIKPMSFVDFENTLRVILDYWKRCMAPSQFDLKTYLAMGE